MAAQLGVSDILTALGLATALAKFEVKNFKQRNGVPYAQRKSRLGDVLQEGALVPIEEYDLTLSIKEFSVSSINLILGGLGYGAAEPKIVITKLGVRQVNNAHPMLSLSVHRHPTRIGDAAVHHARKYTIALPALDWGVNAVLSLDALADEVSSVSFDASVDHVDENNREGTKWMLGTSTNCQLVETIQFTKGATIGALNSAWYEDPEENDETDTEFAAVTMKLHKHQAPDA